MNKTRKHKLHRRDRGQLTRNAPACPRELTAAYPEWPTLCAQWPVQHEVEPRRSSHPRRSGRAGGARPRASGQRPERPATLATRRGVVFLHEVAVPDVDVGQRGRDEFVDEALSRRGRANVLELLKPTVRELGVGAQPRQASLACVELLIGQPPRVPAGRPVVMAPPRDVWRTRSVAPRSSR